jgi:CheY-like chemotaxis protein
MPGLNGIELSRKIREKDVRKHSVIIMISAVEWSSIEKEAKNAGVDKFLSKPFFPSSIMDYINDYVGMGTAWQTKKLRRIIQAVLKDTIFCWPKMYLSTKRYSSPFWNILN